jgi:hypothetical protein
MFKNKAMLLIASSMLAMPGLIQAQGVTPTAGGKGGTVAADQIIARYKAFAGGEANAKSLVNGLRNGSDITLASEEEVCSASQTTCSEYEQTCGTYAQTCTTTPAPCLQTSGCLPGSPGCVNGSRCVLFGSPQTTCVTDTSKCTQYVNSNVCKPGMSTTTCTSWAKQAKSMTFAPGPAAPMGLGNVDIALALTEAKLRPEATPKADALKTALLEILGKRAGGEGWGEIAKSYGFELK